MNKVYILLIALVLSSTFALAMTGSETMTRTSSATVAPSSTFVVTYSAVGTSGLWGASIEDSVSGGCTFPSGSSTYKTVMLSEDGLTKQITITAPASGSCTFTGNYKYGESAINNFVSSTIQIGSTTCAQVLCAPNTCVGTTCTNNCGVVEQGTKNCQTCIPNTCSQLGKNCGSWDNGCGTTISCGSTCQNPCTPSTTCATNTCTGSTCSDGCGGTVQGTKSCSETPASYCAFTSKFAYFSMTGNECTDGLIIVVVGAILLIVLIK